MNTLAMYAAITEVVGYVEAAQEAQRLADLAAQTAREAARLQPPPMTSAGDGFPSEAFFHILARCEEGGNNDPRFGFFGKIDGAWAGLSWAEQVARARVLWAQNANRISQVWTSVPSCTGPPF